MFRDRRWVWSIADWLLLNLARPEAALEIQDRLREGKKGRKAAFTSFLPPRTSIPLIQIFYPAISCVITWRGFSENLIFNTSGKKKSGALILTVIREMILNLESCTQSNTI